MNRAGHAKGGKSVPVRRQSIPKGLEERKRVGSGVSENKPTRKEILCSSGASWGVNFPKVTSLTLCVPLHSPGCRGSGRSRLSELHLHSLCHSLLPVALKTALLRICLPGRGCNLVPGELAGWRRPPG